jgi:hypothetical protein
MWNPEDIERQLNIGTIKLTISVGIDSDPDSSYLGHFCDFRYPTGSGQKLVHIESQTVLGADGLWRNERGQIVSAPAEDGYSRNYKYSWHDNDHTKIKYALQDSQRMEDYASGILCAYGITATVYKEGKEVSSFSLWGIESDAGEIHFRRMAREISLEAIRIAKGQKIDQIWRI